MTPVQQGARLVPTAPGTLARDYAGSCRASTGTGRPTESISAQARRPRTTTAALAAVLCGLPRQRSRRHRPRLYMLWYQSPSSTVACGTARATTGGCMESKREHACASHRLRRPSRTHARVDRSLVHARPPPRPMQAAYE